jgi:hypothetical protein
MEDRRESLTQKKVWRKTYHDRENALFHFTSVFRAKDDHLHTLEVYLDGSSRTHAFCKTVGRKLTSIVDNEIGLAKVAELLFGRADKHIMLK